MPTIREQASAQYRGKLREQAGEMDRFTLNIIRAFIEKIETQLQSGGDHVVFTGDEYKLLQWTLGLLDAHNDVDKEKRRPVAPTVRTIFPDDGDPEQERVGRLTEC